MSKKEKLYITMLLSTTFILFLIWSISYPFGHAPDEPLRYDIANFIYKYKQLPVINDSRLFFDPKYGVNYAALPNFPYILSGIFMIVFKGIGLPFSEFYFARLVSVLSGVGTILFIYLICKKLIKDSIIRYIIPIMVAFIPQFSFICSYVNQDAFMVFLSTVLIYLCIEGRENNWDYNIVIKVGVVGGGILLSYINGYIVLLAVLIYVLITYNNIVSLEFLKKIGICLAIMLLISGWWFLRNAIVNNGDFLGLTATKLFSEKHAVPEFRPSVRPTYHNLGKTMIDVLKDKYWVKTSFYSFWGILGWMNVYLPNLFYRMVDIFTGLFIISLIKMKIDIIRKKVSINNVKLIMVLLFNFVASILLSLYYTVYSDYQAQGRYVYPAFTAIMILNFLFINNMFNKKIATAIITVFTLGFITFNIYTLLYIMPI